MIDSGPITWPPARQRLAAIALLMAILTGAGTAALGESGGRLVGAGVYVVATLAALYSPGAIIAQVIVGQLLAASLAMGRDGSGTVILLPVIVSVIATAELLGVVGRSATAPDHDPTDDLRRTVGTMSIASVIFALVAVVGRFPGPSGVLAIALASAACVVLAILLVSDTR